MSDSEERSELPRLHYVEDEETVSETTTVPTGLQGTTIPQIACFVVASGMRSVGRIVKLSSGMVIGRAVGSDFWLPEDGVSRRHAEVTVLSGARALIRDLGSSNGIYFRGERVQAQVLAEGDRIWLGRASLVLVSMDDVSELLEHNLFQSATVDHITRLPNRLQLIETLDADLSYAERTQGSVAVCLVSLDQLKTVQDNCGAALANHCLRQVARMTRELASGEETFVARYGPEELAIVLPDTSPNEAWFCAESIRRAVRSAVFQKDDKEASMTVSCGVAVWSAGKASRDARALIEEAHRHLSGAISAGRDRVQPVLNKPYASAPP